jgi:acyl carrier protein
MSSRIDFEFDALAIINQVRSHKGLPPVVTVASEHTLRRDLDLDSIDLAEVAVRIEERFGVDVFATGITTTWGDLCQRVRVCVQTKK